MNLLRFRLQGYQTWKRSVRASWPMLPKIRSQISFNSAPWYYKFLRVWICFVPGFKATKHEKDLWDPLVPYRQKYDRELLLTVLRGFINSNSVNLSLSTPSSTALRLPNMGKDLWVPLGTGRQKNDQELILTVLPGFINFNSVNLLLSTPSSSGFKAAKHGKRSVRASWHRSATIRSRINYNSARWLY